MQVLLAPQAAWRGPAAALALLLVRLLLVGPAVAGRLPHDLRSDLTIEPGKQFALGGGQRGFFKVVAKNKGTVPVEIRERLIGGSLVNKATLRPGQSGVLRFAAGSAAVLLNSSAANARLDLTVTGDYGNLRMTTEPLPRTSKAVLTPHLTSAELSDALATWSGTLTYLDYRSQKTTVLPTRARGEMKGPNQVLLHFDYEESSTRHVFGTDTLTVAPDGTRLRWDGTDYIILSKQWLPGQTLRLVLESEARDNDLSATIRKTLTLNPRQMTVKKEVRTSPEAAFFQRHQYQFTR